MGWVENEWNALSGALNLQSFDKFGQTVTHHLYHCSWVPKKRPVSATPIFRSVTISRQMGVVLIAIDGRLTEHG